VSALVTKGFFLGEMKKKNKKSSFGGEGDTDSRLTGKGLGIIKQKKSDHLSMFE